MLLRFLLLGLLLIPVGGWAGSADDPLEAINRPIFVFNDKLDTFVLRPAAKAYDHVVPQRAQRGVGNFFGNLLDINYTVNSLLQGKFGEAMSNAGRVVVNSTLGMFGLFDVATELGIEREQADFGETLAVWGVPEGPYLMVPVFGPRTVRSGVGTMVDLFSSVPTYIEDDVLRYSAFGLALVNERTRLLEADQLISGDRYIFLRDAYLQQRRAAVSDSPITDDFSNFEDDWEEEF